MSKKKPPLTTQSAEPPRILFTPEAARRIRMAKGWLEKMRVSGGGPAFIRLGSRRVAYRVSDLDAWLESRPRCTSTGEK